MKILLRRSLHVILLIMFSVGFTACPGFKKNPDPSEKTTPLSDPDEISKVMVIPGATLETGTPPALTNTSNTPVVDTPTAEINGVSGQDTYITVNYSNVVGEITYIYVRVVGSTYYFKIPITQASGRQGTINVPIQISEKYSVPTCEQLEIMAQARAKNGSGLWISDCGGVKKRSCISFKPKPEAGKGTANINGRSYDATAVCGLDFAYFGTGYAIKIGQSQFIIFYNMNNGGNQLGNFNDLVQNSSTGLPRGPFALYFDGVDIYTSVSGVASVNGKVVSTTLKVENMLEEGEQITLSATGNCE